MHGPGRDPVAPAKPSGDATGMGDDALGRPRRRRCGPWRARCLAELVGPAGVGSGGVSFPD